MTCLISIQTICARLAALLLLSSCVMLCASKNAQQVDLSLKRSDLGDDIRLLCKYLNNSYPEGNHELVWHKSGVRLPKSRSKEKYKYRKNGKVLKVKRASLADSGVYTCIKRHSTNSSLVVINYNISVHKPKAQRTLRFKIEEKILNQRNTKKPAGSDIVFDCVAHGQDPIRYKWYKDGEPLLSRRTDSNLQIDMPELRLRNLVRTDSGNYTCVAQNRWSNLTASMVLFVQERVRASPYIEKATIKNQTRFVGENVSIVCYELITGTIPDFRWLKWTGPLNETLLTNYLQQESGVGAVDDKVAKVIHGKFYRPTKKDATWRSGNGRSVVRGVECMLTNVTIDDSGFYTCIATNHIGEDYASMYLNVIERKDRTKNLKFYERRQPNTINILAVLAAVGFVTSIVLASLLATRGCYQHPPTQHSASLISESIDVEQFLSSSSEA